MKPWQILLLAAVLLNGFIVMAFFFTGSSELIFSVLAGAWLPIAISTALLLWANGITAPNVQQLQKVNIVGFFLKVLLIGIWAVILINAGTIHKMTFIVILLINFLAWHGVEAYYWPLFTAENSRNTGENS